MPSDRLLVHQEDSWRFQFPRLLGCKMHANGYASLGRSNAEKEGDSEYGLDDDFGDSSELGWHEKEKKLLSAVLAANGDLNGENDDTDTSSSERNSNQDAESELFGLEESSTNMQKLLIVSQQSAPVIASFFLGLVGTFINLLFAGRYIRTDGDRSVDFAGISLANMFVNVTCLSLLIGASSAVETLGSQHNGAGNYVQVGLVLQRSIVVLGAMSVPLLVGWYFVYDVYMYIGVERAVCEVIKEYVYIRALAIPADIVNESYEKYLMSMGVMAPAMWSNIVFNICVLGFNCLFVFWFDWGFRALAVSWVLSTYIMTITLIALSLHHPSVQRTLQPFDHRALKEWKEFVVLGLPGTIMLCSEWWAFECLMLLATFLGTPQVAAQAIILQISSIVFMVPLGIGITCASFVGNALGAGKVGLAKQIGKLCLAYTGALNILLGGLILLLGDQFVALFTSDPHVIHETDSAIPFLSMFVMIDGLQGVASGVLRGAGKQYLGAVANVFAYYAVGLPMAYLVCFRLHTGVGGLMMGISAGSLVQVTALFVMIFCFEDYLYGGAVVHKGSGFLPVSMDESTHNPETEGVELSPPRNGLNGYANGKNGTADKASVRNALHMPRSSSDVSVDVTVGDSCSEPDDALDQNHSV